jgi:hypothetical protein
MSKKKSSRSIKAEYNKVDVRGAQANPFGEGDPTVYLTATELSYEAVIAVVRLSIKEAKQVIGLLEQGIKEATKPNKKEKK